VSALGFGLGLALGGCTGRGGATPGDDVCEVSANEARARVRTVIDANATCSTDAECVTVPNAASCFDACFTATNTVGKGAVDRATTVVEASECKIFNESGCKLITPPCVPPSQPRCEGGKCL
jgi:hypothetical protein